MSPVVVFIDELRKRSGVEQVCSMLSEHGCGISPSGYDARRARPASAPVRDELVLTEISRIHADPVLGRGVNTDPKAWHQLKR